MKRQSTHKFALFASIFFASAAFSSAQFNSGSTGADGALDLANMTCPSNICRVQLPESGILNYTTVNIPSGKTLRFIVNSRNTPASVLAQGNIVINGAIDVSSRGGRVNSCGPSVTEELAPGGFRGGQGSMNGFGPGGGTPSHANGQWFGPLALVPIVGGSGGRGGVSGITGGLGGGAITIASSTSIVGTGSVVALGSRHQVDSWGGASCFPFWGSWGSGGAIRLVADSINYAGVCNACGATCGVVRLEATSLNFTGTSNPPAVLSTVNPVIISGPMPRLTISNIAGHLVPLYSGSRFDTIDLLLPNQLADPINVGVSGENIPVGTQVQVGFVSGSASATSTPCILSGNFANSTCTAQISNLTRTAVTYLLATAAFDPPEAASKLNPKGPDHVAKIRIEANLREEMRHVFLDVWGQPIEIVRLRKEFLAHFGIY